VILPLFPADAVSARIVCYQAEGPIISRGPCRAVAPGNPDSVPIGRRYGVSLDAAARGMGVDGKPKGMSGDLAPVLWAEGPREEVFRYVARDARTRLTLMTACEALGAFRQLARSGKRRSMALPEGWLTVELAQGLPLPDTSWMDEPWSRTKFTGWMR